MRNWVWKKPSRKTIFTTMMTVSLLGLFIAVDIWWKRMPTEVHTELSKVELPTKVETTRGPSPTDWDKCISLLSATPNNFKHTVVIILQNRCSVAMNSFDAEFKLYDSIDARIGWLSERIGVMEPGEKVKMENEFDLKNNPLTKDGVSRVQISRLWDGK